MARITHVKKAQQRYKTVPVLDEQGEPVRTPVMRRDGTQKVTKRGRPVFMSKTVADKSQPLPELSCDYPGCSINGGKIAVGSSYKHITPKSGPYGGRQRNRHAEHPNWRIWEYSSSLSARIAQIIDGAETSIPGEATEASDYESVLESAADEIEGLAEEKEEAATNIEEGFGHETSSSADRREEAESLRDWAEELRGVSFDDPPEEPEDDEDEGAVETYESEMEDWRETCSSVVEDALGNSPF